MTASLLFVIGIQSKGQRYLSDIDSLFFIHDTVRPVIKRFENLRITGYIQPQYQAASSQGAPAVIAILNSGSPFGGRHCSRSTLLPQALRASSGYTQKEGRRYRPSQVAWRARRRDTRDRRGLT